MPGLLTGSDAGSAAGGGGQTGHGTATGLGAIGVSCAAADAGIETMAKGTRTRKHFILR
jgi:hypothetical protein